MKVSNIIFAGIAGTTAMTIFSYGVSKHKQKNFKEPELLGEMVHNAVPESKTPQTQAAGWAAHYAVGVLFAAGYSVILNNTPIKPTFINGAILGGISGLPAVASWDTGFTIHPDPPKTNLKKYYAHLLLAHMVFGAFAFLCFNKKIK